MPSVSPKKKPLWTCPRCGHRFVTRNLWHSCGRYPLADHFAGKDKLVRQLFDAFTKLARSYGPVTVYAQKTRIVLQVRVRFAAVITHKHWLDCTLWLKRRAEHPRLRRVELLLPYDHVHHFRLTELAEVDELRDIMREAYAIGCQDQAEDRGILLRTPDRGSRTK